MTLRIMVRFVCTMCGRCCMGMGRYVKIERIMGQSQLLCRHDLSGEMRYVTIEKPYREHFDPEKERIGAKEWCPFLFPAKTEGKYVCIIHQTRPQFCRDFKCCAMRIFDKNGIERGEVKGKKTLSTDDGELDTFWKSDIVPIPYHNDAQWRREAIAALEKAGYRVELYE
jgi:Fe-S-cluster containining protein